MEPTRPAGAESEDWRDLTDWGKREVNRYCWNCFHVIIQQNNSWIRDKRCGWEEERSRSRSRRGSPGEPGEEKQKAPIVVYPCILVPTELRTSSKYVSNLPGE